MCMCVSGGKKFPFFEKFGVLRFLVTHILRCALLPHYQQNVVTKGIKEKGSVLRQKIYF